MHKENKIQIEFHLQSEKISNETNANTIFKGEFRMNALINHSERHTISLPILIILKNDKTEK
jgi:hypothetical protein